MRALQDCRLYAILDTGYCDPAAMPSMLERILTGGADIVQLRAKDFGPDEIADLAAELHRLTSAAGVPLVVNDWPEAAARAGAEGVHVGQDDMTVAEARRRSGGACFVGKSSHSLEQASAAAAEGADYLGFGPLFATPTKPDYSPVGLTDIRGVYARVAVPVFCIGGINLETLPGVVAAGARRVVIVSGILQAPDPLTYVRDCRAILPE